MKKHYILLLITAVVLTACKTNLVYINVTNPAPVTVSKNTRNVGIINRAIPSDENKTLNTIHQNVNGQTLAMIKESTAECMRGLNDALVQNKRFDIVKTIPFPDLRTPVTGSFPSQLSWSEVEKICDDNGVDILFVLEVFDADLKVVPIVAKPNPAAGNNPLEVLNTVTQSQVNINTTVKTGWRIYDPKNKYIIDEFPSAENLSVTANAVTIVNTVEALLGRKEAIKQSANRQGALYANRLIPFWIRVHRDYYVKGSDNLRIATRKARTGNWDGAGELWLKETNNSRRKVAGRACYNMAILGEINGNLDEAIIWAQKSYENYNNKLAWRYVNVLRDRKRTAQRLENQIGTN